jgi:hypothetical protein
MDYVNCYSSTETIRLYRYTLQGNQLRPTWDSFYPVGPAAVIRPLAQARDQTDDEVPIVVNLSECLENLPEEQPGVLLIASREVTRLANLQGRADVVCPWWPTGKEERDSHGRILIRRLECFFDPDQWVYEMAKPTPSETLQETPS